MNVRPKIDVETASRAKLIAYIDELEFRLSDVMPDDDEMVRIREVLHIAPQTTKVLAALMRGRVCSREHLVYSSDIPNDSTRQLEVQIVSARKALKPFGVSIRNVYGVGYYIAPGDLHRLRSLLSGVAS